MDTGCGFDLAKKSHLERCGLGKSIRKTGLKVTLNTPAGPQKVKYEAPISIASLKEEVPVIVLDSTPDVLSIGRRCVEDGYRFVWGAHSDTPYLTTPSGKRINLVVHGYIPYLEPHDPISSDDEDNEEDAAPALSLIHI